MRSERLKGSATHKRLLGRGSKMKKAAYSAMDIAGWFLSRVDRAAGDTITHLKLQKLVYYAQAWYLANYAKPLVKEDFEAWSHGPVCPELWHKYKNHGWDALPAPKPSPDIKKSVDRFLHLLWDVYGDSSAKALERLTHSEDPWKEARGSLPLEAKCSEIISLERMRDYYGARLNERRSGNKTD